MTKRIIFLVSIVFSITLIVILLVFRFKVDNEKGIIKKNEENVEQSKEAVLQEETGETEERVLIQLNTDETYISSFSSDLNEDGLVDEVIAVKKMLQPSIYIILAVQNPDKNSYKKVLEIKTPILVPNSLNIYTIQLQHSLPLIVCAGLGLNNDQTM